MSIMKYETYWYRNLTEARIVVHKEAMPKDSEAMRNHE